MIFEKDDVVRASGEGGTFRVLKVREDGDVEVWGGQGGHLGMKDTTGHAQFRTFKPERLRHVKRKKK